MKGYIQRYCRDIGSRDLWTSWKCHTCTHKVNQVLVSTSALCWLHAVTLIQTSHWKVRGIYFRVFFYTQTEEWRDGNTDREVTVFGLQGGFYWNHSVLPLTSVPSAIWRTPCEKTEDIFKCFLKCISVWHVGKISDPYFNVLSWFCRNSWEGRIRPTIR